MHPQKRRKINGFSLVEVLIASGLMALVSAGLISMVATMGKEQNNQLRTATLREIKSKIQYLITDQNSWARILANNPSMACIRNKTDCTPAVPASPWNDLTLYDSSGGVFFAPPAYTYVSPAWPAASNGFNDKGSPCVNFNGNAGAGVDTCPITYKIVWEPMCPPSGTCKNPLLRITARMIYNSSASAQVAVMSKGDISGSGTWTDDAIAANTGKYDVVLKRSATTINKSFTISITNDGVTSPGTPGGTCSIYPTYTDRGAVGPNWTRIPTDDPFDLVSVSGGTIAIKAGTYSCRIMALGFNVDTFYIRLVDSATKSIVAPGSAATSNAPYITHLQSAANASPVLNLVSDSSFVLQQACSISDPLNPPARAYAMGLPTAPYSNFSTFASISCTQTN